MICVTCRARGAKGKGLCHVQAKSSKGEGSVSRAGKELPGKGLCHVQAKSSKGEGPVCHVQELRMG